MTHHTDTELLPCPFCGSEAHFEMDDDRWEWIECGSCGMQGNRSASLMEDCKPKLAEAWNLRAPAAPVPQGLVKDPKWQIETCHRMFDRMGIERDDGEDFYSVWGRVCLAFEKVANVEIHIPLCGEVVYKQVAAAPQPPEAAPVQLPEYGIDTANHAGIRVRGYTEQQVRELLAAQASVSNGTLASQPPFQTEAGAARQLEEIAVLAWLLVRALRKADPANPRAARALDYLKRHGLQGNPLRAPGD